MKKETGGANVHYVRDKSVSLPGGCSKPVMLFLASRGSFTDWWCHPP